MVGLTYTWPVSAKFGNAHSKEKKNLGIYVVECNIKGEKIFFFYQAMWRHSDSNSLLHCGFHC
jgi:hypothetical protein